MDGGIKGEEWRINLRIRKKRKDFFFRSCFSPFFSLFLGGFGGRPRQWKLEPLDRQCIADEGN